MFESGPIKRACFFKSICGAGLISTLASFSRTFGKEEKPFRLLDHPRHRRDFSDGRSKKVIFLAHCIANQNARMHNCATYPAAVKPVVDFCLEHDIGIVQMPCPELLVMGLGRDRDDPEQEYLCQALRMPLARKRIRKLAEQVVFQMKEYRFQGFTMLGVLGSNGSPSCGVERTAYPDPKKRFGPGEGVFIEELKALMKKEGLDLEFKGLDDKKWQEALSWVRRNLEKAG